MAPKPIEVSRPRDGDDLFEAGEGAAADEQDVGRVDLQELLLRMLAPALRRHGGDGAFHDLEQRLLHALARHVAGDRRIVGLARNLVDFVDIDDAALGALDIIVGRLQQLEDDVLDILADIARLGQRRGVGHGEGHVEDARQRLRQHGLADAGRADQQNVGLRQLDVAMLGGVVEALVMIVDRDREHALGLRLADHIIVEDLADLARRRNAVALLDQRGLVLLADDVHAEFDAFVADEHRRAGDELADLMLALAAKGAVERILGIAAADLAHVCSPDRIGPPGESTQTLDTGAGLTKGGSRPLRWLPALAGPSLCGSPAGAPPGKPGRLASAANAYLI